MDLNSPPTLSWKKKKLLSSLTTIGIGGPCEYYQEIFSIEEMQKQLAYCSLKKIPYFILGKGSNCLFADQGFSGVILHNKISFLEIRENGEFFVGAGYNFSLLGTKTARLGWAGLEFASGIPASVGGAIFMNAGANGKETCLYLKEVWYVHPNGKLEKLKKETLFFSYRTSSFQTMEGSIVAAKFQLEKSENAKKIQKDLLTYRIHTQPYEEMSAGCLFRNPPNKPAGKIIEELGFKGKQVGGAKISEKHANFLINTGNATAQDVLIITKSIQSQSKKVFDISLETEVRWIPFLKKQDE